VELPLVGLEQEKIRLQELELVASEEQKLELQQQISDLERQKKNLGMTQLLDKFTKILMERNNLLVLGVLADELKRVDEARNRAL